MQIFALRVENVAKTTGGNYFLPLLDERPVITVLGQHVFLAGPRDCIDDFSTLLDIGGGGDLTEHMCAGVKRADRLYCMARYRRTDDNDVQPDIQKVVVIAETP